MIKAAPKLFCLIFLAISPALKAQNGPGDPVAIATDVAIRREADTVTLRKKLALAQSARLRNDLKEAARLYQGCYELTEKIGPDAVELEREQTVAGLSSVLMQLADQAQKNQDYREADKDVNRVLAVDPQNQVALAGSSPGFTVAAGGTAPLGYQWFSGASPIAWATNSSMTLTNVSTNQSGLYSVVVSNAVGTASSSNALLSVYATAAASLNSWTTGGGRFGFGISGVPGYNYVVQSSSNLFDWLPLQTNPSPFIFTDQNATNPMEFYRVLYVP